jgi:hypothetical protein
MPREVRRHDKNWGKFEAHKWGGFNARSHQFDAELRKGGVFDWISPIFPSIWQEHLGVAADLDTPTA